MRFLFDVRLQVATTTVVAVLIAISAGCGGGDNSAPSKAEFINRAEAICGKVPGRQKAERRKFWVQHPFFGTAEYREEEEGWKENIVEFVKLPKVLIEARELSELQPPRGDRKEVEAIVRGLKEAVRKGLRHPDVLVPENSVGPFAKVERMARRYGFKTCANPPL